MTNNDKAQFFELLTGIAEIYNQEISAMKGQLYWNALIDLPIETVLRNANAHIRTAKFFPSPAELRQDDSTNDQAIMAWAAVEKAMHTAGYYYSVQFDDRVIHSVIQAMGGWMNLNQEQADNMPFRRKEFLDTYPVLRRRDHHPEYMIGFFEKSNRENKFDEYIPPVKQISTVYVQVGRQLTAGESTHEPDTQTHLQKTGVSGTCQTREKQPDPV